MHDHVGPEFERVLEVRSHEGVVDHHDQVVAMCNLAHLGDVGDLEGGIGGRLHPDEAGTLVDGRFEEGDIAQVHQVELDTGDRGGDALKVAPGSAVGVVNRDHFITRLEQGEDHCGSGSQSGTETQAVLAALERCEVALERCTSRVATTRVVEAGRVQNTWRVLHKGGGQRDRGHHRSGVWVRCLTGMHSQCAKVIVGRRFGGLRRRHDCSGDEESRIFTKGYRRFNTTTTTTVRVDYY
mmetsp:Transcript_40445/g.101793  ORF Transcript_40445/g.101793 Transcript_40445/m.101793 type:complete len:239 (-) Transcript_40445:28-744(-)